MTSDRMRERADVLDFIRNPPGRVPDHMRASLAELVAAIERGDHTGCASRLYEEAEMLLDGWEWSDQDARVALGPLFEGHNPMNVPDVRRFVAIEDGRVEFQFEQDAEPLDVVRAVIARHDRLAAKGGPT